MSFFFLEKSNVFNFDQINIYEKIINTYGA
jgi:hypothetical protein